MTHHKVRPMFDQRVLPITEDLIIAATAIHHGFTVVTRDRSGYDKARVQVLNPWEE
jgi:toxin FitB